MNETRELIAIALPRHALIYLVRMLSKERDRLVMMNLAAYGRLIEHEAAFDSLRELEDAIPLEIWQEGQRP